MTRPCCALLIAALSATTAPTITAQAAKAKLPTETNATEEAPCQIPLELQGRLDVLALRTAKERQSRARDAVLTAEYEGLALAYPAEPRVHEALVEALRDLAPLRLDGLLARYKEAAQAASAPPMRYGYALMLAAVGKKQKALLELTALALAAPRFAPAQRALAENAELALQKRRAAYAAFLAVCPADLAAAADALALAASTERSAEKIASLRERVLAMPVEAVAELYPHLWALERAASAASMPSSAPASHVREDLDRLIAAVPTRAVLVSALAAHRLLDSASNDAAKVALEDTLVRRFPYAKETRAMLKSVLRVGTGWPTASAGPRAASAAGADGSEPDRDTSSRSERAGPGAWQAHAERVLIASDAWIARFPQREEPWHERLLALGAIPHAPLALVRDLSVRYMALHRQGPQDEPLALDIAELLIAQGVDLDRVPLLLSEARAKDTPGLGNRMLLVEAALALRQHDLDGARTRLSLLKPGGDAAVSSDEEAQALCLHARIERRAGSPTAALAELLRALSLFAVAQDDARALGCQRELQALWKDFGGSDAALLWLLPNAS